MGFLEDELIEVSQLCERVVESSKLVTCVPAMVRVEINITYFKAIVICLQFPTGYPNKPLLLELKTKTLSDRLLHGLTDICEMKLKEMNGKAQIMGIIKFIHSYISENPLCCCFDELNKIRNVLEGNGTLKLKQKTSTISLDIFSGEYNFKMKLVVPYDYPKTAVRIEEYTSNFPDVFIRYLIGQARELSRRCVEPPLNSKLKNNNQNQARTFKPSPSLQISAQFIIETVLRFPKELCPVCKVQCLPDKPEDAIKDSTHIKHVERVLCGHLYHQGCLTSYISSPPFPSGGKLCPSCDRRLQHERWCVDMRTAEQRWAHQKAREREIDEVRDFLQ